MQIMYMQTPSSSSSCFFSLLLFFLLFCHGRALDVKTPMVPALLVFGDSIVDPGNNNKLSTLIKCNFPPYGKDFIAHMPTGRFSNGKIPSDLIASTLRIKDYVPAYYDPMLTTQDILTGVSFASGGSGYDSLTPKIVSALSLSDQIDMFKDYMGKLKSIAGEESAAKILNDSLYISIIGTDDIANTYFSTPFRRIDYDIPSYTELLVKSASDFYERLYELGARKVGVAGLPPVGCVPSQRTVAGGLSRECVDSYNQAAITVNSRLNEELKKLQARLPGLNMVYIDIYSILDDIIKRPKDYGFEISNKGCCGTGTIEVTLLCNSLTPPCEDVTKFVFWDSYHPTEKAYKVMVDIIAKKYLSLLIS